jgi:hypothetical protein
MKAEITINRGELSNIFFIVRILAKGIGFTRTELD